jgi:hypothetical protein
MNKKLFFPIFSLLFLEAISSSAQIDSVEQHPRAKEESFVIHQMNIVKTNLTGIVLKNYSLQYERVLNRKFSVALQYRMMPSSTIPFQKLVLKQVGDDANTKKIIEDFRMSNYAITPEVRFYVGKKGYGRGFYIAPFYRYASFTSNNLNIFYTDDNDVESSIKLSGKLTSNTGGIMFGMQHFFGKHIIMDTWLLGVHFGTGTGNFTGASSKTLSQTEQDDIKQQLENIDIPLTNKTVTVNANNASLKLDGPWGGLRWGVSLGYKF